ncbi:MAG: hypothetical protein BWY23_02358 [Spirochaetes bacterium ADurb.Bin218]|nr:MAG: hypothetical protein BWY23_02358 [Spirochaetes bacterium ADurb.Bin218]
MKKLKTLSFTMLFFLLFLPLEFEKYTKSPFDAMLNVNLLSSKGYLFAAMMKCPICHKFRSTDRMYVCSKCGIKLCPTCYNNNHKCPICGAYKTQIKKNW